MEVSYPSLIQTVLAEAPGIEANASTSPALVTMIPTHRFTDQWKATFR